MEYKQYQTDVGVELGELEDKVGGGEWGVGSGEWGVVVVWWVVMRYDMVCCFSVCSTPRILSLQPPSHIPSHPLILSPHPSTPHT